MSTPALLRMFAALLAFASIAHAQAPAKVVRVGYLAPTPHAERLAAFREAMAARGYVEGKNLVIEVRDAGGRFDQLPALARELARLRVDVIVSSLTQATLAAKGATTTIPVVMAAVGDPVGAGIVRSLAKPSANITGNSLASIDVIGKLVELLRELRPSLASFAILVNPANPVFGAQQLTEAKAAAAKLRMKILVVEATHPDALESAFKTIAASDAAGLLILGDPTFAAHAERIARFALERRLPAVSGFAVFTDAGGLASYGADFNEAFRRAAAYVDQLLRGAKPADLPVEQATRFELVVNLKTAKALGIEVPPALASRADRVVQ